MEKEHVHVMVNNEHKHPHVHSETGIVVKRLINTIEHLKEVKDMVHIGKDCADVLIQLSTVKLEINDTGRIILKDHILHCIVEAVESGDFETVNELNKAINQFVK